MNLSTLVMPETEDELSRVAQGLLRPNNRLRLLREPAAGIKKAKLRGYPVSIDVLNLLGWIGVASRPIPIAI